MSTVAFSEVERDFLRANAQRLQFEKLAEAARVAYVGAAVNSALFEFVTCMRWLSGGQDYISFCYTWQTGIRVLRGE